MGQLACLCGHRMSNCSDINEYCGTIAPDYLVDYAWDEMAEPDRYEVVADKARDVWECPECGRLAIQYMPGENRYKYYKPEDDKPGHLFAHKNNE